MKNGKKRNFNQGAITVAVALMFQSQPLLANPTGAQVVNGTVSMVKPNSATLNVTNSPGSIINWQGFSIGAGEVTRFIQQSSSSAVLNRVVGADISSIQGQLLSNGRVFLINPAGIVIGPNAMLDTAGFIGSTLNMQNADFLAGKLRFAGDASSGAIINQGWIRTSYGGNVLLVAPRIENSGLIQTPGGELILAAGQKVTVSSLEQEGVQFEVQAPTDSVVNIGKLLADGGAVGVFAGTLKHSGDIRANALTRDEGGRIVLKAGGDVTLASGSTTIANGKSGGTITVQSYTGTTLVSGTVEARGLLPFHEPPRPGGDSTRPSPSGRRAGDEGRDAMFTAPIRDVRVVASLPSGQGNTWSGAEGGGEGRGGTIHILGNRVGVIDNAVIDASGERGGGQVLIGGDFQGKNADVQNAARTFVGPDTVLRADAKTDGDGGKVIVWADEVTRVQGTMSARGGAWSGNGGLIETSGKQVLVVGDSTRVDMSAPNGRGGNWLLDPHDITVQTAGANAATTDVDKFGNTPATDKTISPATIAGVTGGTVTLQANNDIMFVDAVTLTNTVNLSAFAGRNIAVKNDITVSNANARFFVNDAGAIAANRDLGNAGFTMSPGTKITATNGIFQVMIEAGGPSGDITLANINAQHVSVEHKGPTANGSILRQTGNPTITVANSGNVHLEIEVAAGGPTSTIGTNANPITITTPAGGTAFLESHYHGGGGGIFIDALTNLQVGGATAVFSGAVKGVQTLAAAGAAGPIQLNVTGNLLQLTGGPPICGAGGGGGPVCAGAPGSANALDVVTLRAADMNLTMPIAGNSVILLPQAGGTIGMAGGGGALQLSNAEIGQINTTSLRIGERTALPAPLISDPSSSGSITFGAAGITAPGTASLEFRTGGDVLTGGGANDITTTNANVTIYAGPAVGAAGTGRLKVNPGTGTGAGNVLVRTISGGVPNSGTVFIERSGGGGGDLVFDKWDLGGGNLELATTNGGMAGNFVSTGNPNWTLRTLAAGGNITFTGNGTVDAASLALIPGGATVITSGTRVFNTPISTSRPFLATGGNTTFNQPVTTTNAIQMVGANFTFANTVNATTTAGGLLVNSGATATFKGTSSFGGKLILGAGTGSAIFDGTTVFFDGAQINGGTLAGTGSVTTNNGMTWTAGTISNTGGVIVTPGSGGLSINTGAPTLTGKLSTDLIGIAIGSSFNIGANGVFTLSGATTSSTNGSTLNIANTGAMLITGKGGLSMNGPGGLIINAGGLLDFQNDASIVGAGGIIPTVTNNGTVRKSAGTGISRVGLTGGTALNFTNTATGKIDVQMGILQAASGFSANAGIINVAATGATFSTNNTTLTNTSTGTITGRGTIDVGTGTLINDGVLSPGTSPGTLTINGNLMLTSGSKVNIDIQSPGLMQGTHYDFINVTGAVTLDGILNVTTIPVFAPGAGQIFNIMNSSAAIAGDFTSKNFLGGVSYTAAPNANLYQLTAIGGSSGSSSSSNSSNTTDIINTVVSDQSRIRQAVPDDDGEHGESKKPLIAPQCT